MASYKHIVKQTTIRADERMLDNIAFIRKYVARNEDVYLSNSDCIRKSLEFMRKSLEQTLINKQKKTEKIEEIKKENTFKR